jgi:hypothetical protein
MLSTGGQLAFIQLENVTMATRKKAKKKSQPRLDDGPGPHFDDGPGPHAKKKAKKKAAKRK